MFRVTCSQGRKVPSVDLARFALVRQHFTLLLHLHCGLHNALKIRVYVLLCIDSIE